MVCSGFFGRSCRVWIGLDRRTMEAICHRVDCWLGDLVALRILCVKDRRCGLSNLEGILFAFFKDAWLIE